MARPFLKPVSPEPLYLYTRQTPGAGANDGQELIALNSEHHEAHYRRMRNFYLSLALGVGFMFLATAVGLAVVSIEYYELCEDFDTLLSVANVNFTQVAQFNAVNSTDTAASLG